MATTRGHRDGSGGGLPRRVTSPRRQGEGGRRCRDRSLCLPTVQERALGLPRGARCCERGSRHEERADRRRPPRRRELACRGSATLSTCSGSPASPANGAGLIHRRQRLFSPIFAKSSRKGAGGRLEQVEWARNAARRAGAMPAEPGSRRDVTVRTHANLAVKAVRAWSFCPRGLVGPSGGQTGGLEACSGRLRSPTRLERRERGLGGRSERAVPWTCSS